MTNNDQNVIEVEDEDIVLQGSELHLALTEIGFNDFESAPVHRTKYFDTEITHNELWTKVFLPINEKIYDPICNSILYTLQDNEFLDKQLRIILRLDCLLDDHVSKIQSFINKKKQSFWKKAVLWLPLLGSSVTMVACELNGKYKNILSIALATSVLSLSAQRKFLRWTLSKNLKRLIFLQNELYHSCKSSLKILRYSFRMRLDSGKSGQKFIELEKSKQMYLPPLTEILISSLEKVSLMYHRASVAILKLLPISFSTDDLITAFERDSFFVRGEVTYQTLKNLYYTYLLVQSEMLHLLAIAYNRDTWKNAGALPEMKLSHIIINLAKILDKHNAKILKVLNEYSSKKFVPEHREYKGSKVSKFQDLYVHLDLIAYRLQTAYKVILSTLEEIDSHADVNSNEDVSETIMQNLNEVYKQIDTARSFTEFSSLLVAKVQHEQSKEQGFKESRPIPQESKSELPVVLDSEPQIVDEVFEEYIKEEYLKPLYEDGDESIAQNYKFDKLLAKNFMSELKDALLEKHKSMSERESKALQRMYKNVTQEVSCKQGDNTSSEIQNTVSPLSFSVPFNISASLNDDDGFKYEQKRAVLSIPDHINSGRVTENINLKNENELKTSKDSQHEKHSLNKISIPTFCQNVDQKDDEQINVQRFSIIECKPNLQFPPFLKVAEETFIGSGENSEEELVESESEEQET